MTASWTPTVREQDSQRRTAMSIAAAAGRCDLDWLADHHGTVTALDAPHAAHPERLSFADLAQRIATAAAAFQAHGVAQPGTWWRCSPRTVRAGWWLIRA